ncbi:PHP domain-containing protein [Actinoalloteichus fjordicus]|uniref:Metal-dependent phosphoesterase, PHP family n=1 Tax=Actinoalloteichus fjordicus TaxID=1612552 RepID=A0AAC9LAU2_9PSEU|nr:PHP domain-containing protein [Actinoalloteichus fjordicus]APU13015.1 putative metal-dependent phosphoesterase, PHP family [Actinoalloteichus fjordicus]
MRIDLHTHSTASDGSDAPEELVRLAALAGLDVVALTDHDTTAGWDRATAALPAGLRLVPGAELSCAARDETGGPVTVHLLAYLFDPTASEIVEEQARLRAERRTRLRLMAERMVEQGHPIDVPALFAALPPDAPAGRPHLARALMQAGVVESVDEAFRRFLGTGGRFHLGRTDTPVLRAVEMIRRAGGATVLAHPFARSRGPVVDAQTIAELAEAGLAGVEVDHPDHDLPTRRELRGLAGELGLLTTGSSDYHGTNKTLSLGEETTDPAQFEALVAQTSGTEVRVGLGR